MLKKTLPVLVMILVLVMSLLAGCAQTGDTSPSPSDSTMPSATPSESTEPSPSMPEKDAIVIGAVRSQSGVFALFDETAFGPCYRMWASEVNAAGGIYVEEYGKKLPVELIVYDDTSDLGQMTQLYQKLILEDEVDFLLPPVSTAFLNAAVPIAAQYGYLMIGAEGGSESLKATLADHPNFFSVLNYTETQIPAMVEIFNELGVESAFIVYVQDTHGLEYSGAAAAQFPAAGIEILDSVDVPPDIADMTPIVNAAKDSGADAFIMFTYPDQTFPAITIAQNIGYNPDVFLVGPGGSFDALKFVFGEAAVEGIMYEGAWNTKSSPEAADFAARLQEFNKDAEGFGMDWWGHNVYYAGLEVLQEAIEQSGTLDNSVIAQYIKDNHFTTVLGDTYFIDQELAPECYMGQIGQWQSGFPEVIDVGDNRTADPIYPKPEWAPAA